MRSHRSLTGFVAVGILVVSITPALRGDFSTTVTKVGKHGATIKLEDEWIRKPVNADLGEDQFVLRKRVQGERGVVVLVVLELEARVENRFDLE